MRRFRVQLTNDSIGALNPAYVGFDFLGGPSGGGTKEEVGAQIIAFFYISQFAAGGSRIAGITVATDNGPGVALPFPVDALNAMSDPDVAFGTTYGEVPFGAGALAPVGTSILLTEHTAVGGRHNGRCYLPYAAAATIDAAGLVSAATATQVIESYRLAIMGDPSLTPSGWATVEPHPVVGQKVGSGVLATFTEHEVITATCSRTPATLSSRKR